MITVRGPLNARGWALVGVALLILVLAVALWWQVGRGDRRAREAVQARAEAQLAQADAGAGKATIEIVADQATREAKTEAVTQENRDAILNAPGADADAGPVADIGLRRLCERPTYRDSRRCAELRGVRP